VLGSLLENTGKPEEAERAWLEALAIMDASANPPVSLKREVLKNLSTHYRTQNNPELARKYEARLAEFEKTLADKDEG